MSSCRSNSDHACFCPSADFIANVQDCVSAWSTSDTEITAALSYLAGICADFLPQNPGICTGVPSTITLVPETSTVTATETVTAGNGRGTRPPVGPPSGGFNIPVTTLTLVQTRGGETVTTAYTVPQVEFVTTEPTGTATVPAVGLVPAVPALATGTGSSSGSGSGSGSGAPGAPGAGNGAGSPPAATTAAAAAGGAPSGTATGTRPAAATFTGAANRQSVGFGCLAALLAVAAFVF